jgi:hypothetical protein
MKRTVCLLAVFVLAISVLYADEVKNTGNSNRRGLFDLGAGYTYTSNPKLHGGHIEFGISLYRKVFYVQNRFMLRAGGFRADDLDNTVLTLSEKLVFGRTDDDTGIYIYLEGGAGFYGNKNQGFSRDTLAYSFGFGGGFEAAFDVNYGGIYVEVGYLGQIMTQNFFPLSGVIVQTGWKFFF